MTLTRVFVANRGEIAVRVIRACRALGISSVAAVSEADAGGLAAEMADAAVTIGPPPPAQSYLNIDAVLDGAERAGADALHPGYGFLAEHPELARACAARGIKFIGPDADTILRMGNKLEAREAVGRLGVPVVPGSSKVGSLAAARSVAAEIGYPLLMKAAAGGGGRGIKIVGGAGDLDEAFATAGNEARGAFGDDTLYMERYIGDARHVEVQVLGDGTGTVIHAGERDCSLQRRYQKAVEEAPASALPDSLREDIRAAAVAIAADIRYENAGTVEFIVDQEAGRFYFLEMNTRIQVEHPVTEMITGLDLVAEQIRIAGGDPLSVAQADIGFHGHAIECRITAEDSAHGFQPRPGRIIEWRPPEGEGIRVDSHCREGEEVTPYYDSLLAKLVVKGENRIRAVARLQEALAAFTVTGVETTIPFLRLLACQLDFVKGEVNTRWLESNLDALKDGI
ncbi:MAG: acetyl-CoA carboxylase biotin carboxylase subunit [Alphaproteobacteria bacterium]|nr:acetyl-CoA carboxylase biotin carboxylase subunit [Alphaproteobacteria bacterium]